MINLLIISLSTPTRCESSRDLPCHALGRTAQRGEDGEDKDGGLQHGFPTHNIGESTVQGSL